MVPHKQQTKSVACSARKRVIITDRQTDRQSNLAAAAALLRSLLLLLKLHVYIRPLNRSGLFPFGRVVVFRAATELALEQQRLSSPKIHAAGSGW